ncbi:hypothetical protein DTO021D3_5428 [Paecilomyces variotii]|nr:hypothetical protein DTO032I3_5754 [Paecilomyces variotii]KAJ9277594.1 hypothetical protein DTO021D3_5428 [Paecilomyces variotii]KAJ9306109.1 hypothetical protein DTO217A2_4409 [Paecilomyces variotii]KAJ9341854.1 hypothetical protein DTO027B6_5504 [Paecilomyces variotii]KAJ9389241.1 hypothetical protein DTO032I4_2266 [Paecilomyces variotii]
MNGRDSKSHRPVKPPPTFLSSRAFRQARVTRGPWLSWTVNTAADPPSRSSKRNQIILAAKYPLGYRLYSFRTRSAALSSALRREPRDNVLTCILWLDLDSISYQVPASLNPSVRLLYTSGTSRSNEPRSFTQDLRLGCGVLSIACCLDCSDGIPSLIQSASSLFTCNIPFPFLIRRSAIDRFRHRIPSPLYLASYSHNTSPVDIGGC